MNLENMIVTVDLDSTACDTEQRWPMIDRVNGTDWDAYSLACENDAPVQSILALCRLLISLGVEVHALSARKSVAEAITVAWFQKHEAPLTRYWLDEGTTQDYGAKSDHVTYKLARLREIEKQTGKKVYLHIDDWAGIAARFEAEGIPTICVRTPTEVREIAEFGKVVSQVGF